MNIDYDAPLHARKEILIAAPIERVWSDITAIDQWPEWQPDVTTSRLAGDLAVGTNFYWKAKGLTIVSKIAILEPMKSIGWTGRSMGMQAIHIWSFVEGADGTHVTTEESLSGWFPRLLKFFDPQFLEKSLLNSLQVLKMRSEGR